MGKITIINTIKNYGSLYGASSLSFLILIVFILYNIPLGFWYFIGLIISYSVTSMIRVFYYKPRPSTFVISNPPLLKRITASSFPSAHVQRAILTTYFCSLISIYFLIIGGILVVIVMISRYVRKRHDFYDIVVGAILGIIYSIIFKTLIF